MNLANLFNTKNVINNGARCTLHRGEVVRYVNLPEQPIAVVMCNNTDQTVRVRLGYNNDYPQSFIIAPPQESGFSAGHIYLMNPALTHNYEIALALPKDIEENASVDVYLISSFLPFHDDKIQNVAVPFDEDFVPFQGYSRMYCTPQFSWYLMQVDSTQKGLISLFFQDNKVKIIGLNIASHQECTFRDLVTIGSGMDTNKVTFARQESTRWQYEFFGSITQVVFSPILKVDRAMVGQLSLLTKN
ncbi:MAG TPA: hypothetical protein DCS93_25515 [Microscillaceae bacterium]|nr:hypothetical protein [Microscillaceae bacterium]